jgi:hypothetical protein
VPVRSDGCLSGFLLNGRWPEDPVEWSQVLLLAVQVAALPGMLPLGSTVFRVVDDDHDGLPEGAVGRVVAEGQLLGEHPLEPGLFADQHPPGLAILHPPRNTMASVPEYETASGCILLPGAPDLGLDHQAAWVEADAEGHVTRLASKIRVDLQGDVDTACLSLLLAA